MDPEPASRSAMEASGTDPEPASRNGADAGDGPAATRRRPLGAWLVLAALGLWLGVMLFTVGPFSPGNPPEEPAAASLSAGAPALAADVPAPGNAGAPAPGDAGAARGPRGRSAEPRLIPVSRREPAAGFALPELDGGETTLADYSGRVLLLNFWATWCLPCRAEMPWFVEFQTAFGDDGFAVLGVSVDEPGHVVASFLERSPVNYRIVLADTAARLAPFGPKNVLPTTWLIDRQGRIAAEHVGLVNREAVEAEIRLLLAE